MVLIGFTTDRSKVPHFVNQNALLALIMSGCAVILPFLRVSFDGCFTLRCLSRRSTITLLSSSLLSILPCCGFASYFCADDNCQKVGEKGNKRTVVKGWRFLPQTPYSISEVDQGVALCVGIVTLLLSIRDMIQDYNFSLYDKFEYWRIRCVRNIELGNTNVDVARWKQELDSIDKKAECERTRARHRKRELETWASLPEVKRAYEQYRIAKGLSDSGLL
jgi:hypothetical protein